MKIIESLSATNTAVLRPIKKYNDKLCISTQNANLIVKKSDISYLKADSNYCLIHLHDGNNIICSKTLKEINLRIRSAEFIRVHKSFVVNVNEIVSLNVDYSELTLRGGTNIPISRARKGNIREVISNMFD